MVTKLTALLLHLHPDKAKLLAELSDETRIPKSVLMREAIDDLLVKHGKGRNPWYEDIVYVLRLAKTVATRIRSTSTETNWQGKAEELRKRASDILAALGKN